MMLSIRKVLKLKSLFYKLNVILIGMFYKQITTCYLIKIKSLRNNNKPMKVKESTNF